MTTCFHRDSPDLRPPSASEAVYREDCTQCFDSIDDESGLNVCLYCFNGGCSGSRDHARLHYERFGHPLALNIRRTRKQVQREEPPHKISKLAINAETDEDRYYTRTRVMCYACGQDDVDKSNSKLQLVIDGVMNAITYSKKEEIKAWEQEFVPCEHTLGLVQQKNKNVESQDLSQCSMCDLQQNLWLCLECGNLGCGRSQFGGTGGNSHGLAHFDATFHPVAVKLGSITADGSADIYCYKCNEERTDPDLATHLAHWGINLSNREKTEKSLMEMQVEQNLKWDFTMTTGDGHGLHPVFGEGLTGLSNLGNSCYLSSVVQCLFDLPEFRLRYYHPGDQPPFSEAPASDFETQLRKLADGTLSGRYSRPDDKIVTSPEPPEVTHQRGLAPSMFKHLIGRDHAEFSTMRQQDAFEFLLHVFKHVTMSKHPVGMANPIESFRFSMEQRLKCLNCRKVRYRLDEQDNISIPVPVRRLASQDDISSSAFEPVTLGECLDVFTAEEAVDLRCPSCDRQEKFSKRSAFRTMPAQLVINARRFELINWVPTKLDIPVEVHDEPIDLSRYLSAGPDENEEMLPNDKASGSNFEADADILNQLLGIGFPQVRCEKALYSTGNSDAEAAMNWLLSHMDDPDIDEPMVHKPTAGSGASNADADLTQVRQLNEMGIDDSRAKRALAATGGDISRAIDWVFSHPEDVGEGVQEQESTEALGASTTTPGSDARPAVYQLRSIICHKGSSVHAGHYVAFVRKKLPGKSEPSWVMFNDEKVVEVDDIQEVKRFAYLYFFSRV